MKSFRGINALPIWYSGKTTSIYVGKNYTENIRHRIFREIWFVMKFKEFPQKWQIVVFVTIKLVNIHNYFPIYLRYIIQGILQGVLEYWDDWVQQNFPDNRNPDNCGTNILKSWTKLKNVADFWTDMKHCALYLWYCFMKTSHKYGLWVSPCRHFYDQ